MEHTFLLRPAQGADVPLLRTLTGGAIVVLEPVSTMPGEPLCRALGFTEVERFDLLLAGGVRVPVARMRRPV